jgi:hypothetical protein
VLEPGGHLFLTINDKHSLGIVRRNPGFNLAQRISEAEKRMPLSKVDFAMASIMRSYTLYDIEYLKEKLDSIYEILAVEQEIYGFQTGLLLQKRGGGDRHT